MLKIATPPALAIDGSTAPVGLTIVDAIDDMRDDYTPLFHRQHDDLSEIEVDDVRATALAWLSDIARG